MNVSKSRPTMNFYHLQLNPEQNKNWLQAEEKKMTTSIKNEANVLMMAAGSESTTSAYLWEVYQDYPSYQNYLNSPQFKAYQEATKDAVDETDSFNLNPQLIASNSQDLQVLKDNHYRINLVKITLVDYDLNKFGKIIKKEMTQSFKEEPGIVAILAGNMFDIENEWRILEIYQDEAAYQKHLHTQNFIDYVEQTKEMIYQKEVLQLHGGLIVDRANLNFEM